MYTSQERILVRVMLVTTDDQHVVKTSQEMIKVENVLFTADDHHVAMPPAASQL